MSFSFQSAEYPRDVALSEEPGRQGAKREAATAPTSRQAMWSGEAWLEHEHMGVTSGAEHAGVAA
jgi:hypothetical protein